QHIKDAQERSPLKGLANIDAPVLILHGRLDRRVPFGQSVRLCDTLKAMGKDARLLLYPVAGHGIMWHGEAVDDVTAFLDRHLK
ncbi:MAG: prolyl oligopeptidase family serine peptidase, partial [Nitrospirota bacterium]